ncbi:hypothetical protein AM609_10570 [Actinomyces sp. oral taxon 414]|uniref:hypothetical protein n=1 Tax=Actinomyces sp. oral taxon 414 TaxID=712122 RepID=UPI0006AE1993|nr:hypothetical protein [Actinomyces sp. oral taxon 414]ALC99803.1 hypothetical protein AM609_10570 [Actinomyces sp. oral taxon 414]
MTAGPPSGGRPPLTDAKPLVFTGIHSRVGMWSIVLSVVFLSLYLSIPYLLFFSSLKNLSSFREMSDDWLDIGTIMLLVQIVPLVIGGLVGIVFILRHRQRLCVDAGGFRIRTGRRSRTLGWDQVRGNLAIAIIPQHGRSPIGIKFDLKPLLLPVITVEGERIELPCLISGSYNELRARRHVERVMAAIAARDPGPGTGTVDPPRPDGLILTEHRDKEASRFFYLGIACGFLIQAWQAWWSDYADAPIRIFAGGLAVLGLGLIMLEVHGLRPDDTTTADASGLRIRRGWRRRNLSWDQVRGHLEARAIPPNGKGGLSRGGTWSWGWRAQVHYRDGDRDVPLAGASLMAWDEASALQLARERIDLLRSYDPDPTATAWSQPTAPAHPSASSSTQYGIPAPQPAAPNRPPARTPSPYAAQPYPSAPTAPSDDSWREPGLYGRPASAWEIMTSPAGKAIDKKEGLQ